MNVKNLARKVLKAFYSLTDIVVWIGYAALAVIVLVVFVSACARYFLRNPIRGDFELVLLSIITLGGFSILCTTIEREHVAIDLLVSRFSRHTRMIMQSIYSLLGFAVWATLAYQTYLRALDSRGTTAALRIPMAPVLMILAGAILLCCLASLIQIFYPVVQEERQDKEDGIIE